jgi:hypothetical protein
MASPSVAHWLDAAPPGLVIRLEGATFRKNLLLWDCVSVTGEHTNLIGKSVTSADVAHRQWFSITRPPRPGPEIWVTHDGRQIPIKNLMDNHLINICGSFLHKWVIRQAREQRRGRLFAAEPPGDHAADAVEQELLHMPAPGDLPEPGEFEQAMRDYEPKGQIALLVAEVRERKLEDRMGEDFAEHFLQDAG